MKRISLFARSSRDLRDLREKRDGSKVLSSRVAPVAHVLLVSLTIHKPPKRTALLNSPLATMLPPASFEPLVRRGAARSAYSPPSHASACVVLICKPPRRADSWIDYEICSLSRWVEQDERLNKCWMFK